MTDDAAEIARWRERVELVDGMLVWRSDPARAKHWNSTWAGKPAPKRVIIGGRKLSSARIAEALATGRIPPERFISLASRRSGSPKPDVQVSVCPDYEEITRLSAALGRTTVDLVALSKVRDPFFVMPFRLAQAHWFADVWRVLAPGAGIHIRRLHYRYVSLPVGERPPNMNGQPYENTDRDYQTFTDASQDARSLGLVDETMFTDRRNGEPKFIANNDDEDTEASVSVYGASPAAPKPEEFAFWYSPTEFNFPDPPDVYISRPSLTEPYALEIWAEKSTMNDVLEPLTQRLNVTLVTGVGELSYTHCMWHVGRVLAHRKKTRILYISDFDPAGFRMPVSIARKIEFLLRRDGHDLDIRLEPLVLTADQVRRYRLPRIPIKDSDGGKARFEAQHGEGAVELDALEALHPGELARILEAAIDVYRAPTRQAERENRAIAVAARDEALEAREEVLAEFDSEIEALRNAFDDMQAAIKADQDALAAIAADAAEQGRAHVEAINARATEFHQRATALWARIGAELEDRVPDADDFDWVEPAEDDEDDDPLFDSTRDYLGQIDRYKARRGRP